MSGSDYDVTVMEDPEYEMVKKRVGGGYKYVKVKKEVKQKKIDPIQSKENKVHDSIHEEISDDSEKHEFEKSEKGGKETIVSLVS